MLSRGAVPGAVLAAGQHQGEEQPARGLKRTQRVGVPERAAHARVVLAAAQVPDPAAD